MKLLLLLLFPRDVRERHGAEMLDSIADSGRPARDAADLVLAAIRLRLDRAFSDGRMTYSLGVGLVMMTSAGALFWDCTMLGSMAIAGAGGLFVLGFTTRLAGHDGGATA